VDHADGVDSACQECNIPDCQRGTIHSTWDAACVVAETVEILIKHERLSEGMVVLLFLIIDQVAFSGLRYLLRRTRLSEFQRIKSREALCLNEPHHLI
jgi:hypothetical protein